LSCNDYEIVRVEMGFDRPEAFSLWWRCVTAATQSNFNSFL